MSDDGQKGAAAGVGASDDNWLYMSAVCYLFGLELQASLDVPIGLMNTNWGLVRSEAEKDFYVIVQSACGHEQIMDTKVMTN